MLLVAAQNFSGAKFFRGNLHIHSYCASYDVNDVTATPQAIIDTARREGLAIIALADHNEICNVRPAIEAGIANNVVVIPAVELSTPEGHLLCYAPTADRLERFFHRLQIAARRTPQCRCQTSTLDCLGLIEAEGGFGILAHIESNGAFESNMPRFTPAKLDILCHPALEGIEVTSADCPIIYTINDPVAERRSAAGDRIRRLGLGSQQFLARVLNSDAHTLNAIGRNANSNRRITRYKMETPSFEGLRLALQTADTRIRIEDELPDVVPIVQGVHFQGGFLNSQAINFSPNLTCIIGGRGSGKSTTFEGLCLLNGPPSPDVTVIDSDVWPEMLSLIYRDETKHCHRLARSKESPIENLDDPVSGSCSFPIESYRQGATNEISKRVQGDPLALLTFLDNLMPIKAAIVAEDELREQLVELFPQIGKATDKVDTIPNYERELKLKSDQLERLRKDKGEEVIRLQQQLEGEKRARMAIEHTLGKLMGAVDSDAITEITTNIKDLVENESIEIATDEATQIQIDTGIY